MRTYTHTLFEYPPGKTKLLKEHVHLSVRGHAVSQIVALKPPGTQEGGRIAPAADNVFAGHRYLLSHIEHIQTYYVEVVN